MAYNLRDKIYTGASADFNYGPWDSISAYTAKLLEEVGRKSPEFGTVIAVYNADQTAITEYQYIGGAWKERNAASIDVDEIKLARLDVETVEGVKKIVARNAKGAELASVDVEKIGVTGQSVEITYNDPVINLKYSNATASQTKITNQSTWVQTSSDGKTNSGYLSEQKVVQYKLVFDSGVTAFASIASNGEVIINSENTSTSSRKFKVRAFGTINGADFDVTSGYVTQAGKTTETMVSGTSFKLAMWNVGSWSKAGDKPDSDRDYSSTNGAQMEADKNEYIKAIKAVTSDGTMPDVLGICEYDDVFCTPTMYADDYLFGEYTSKKKTVTGSGKYFTNALLSKGITITDSYEVSHVGVTTNGWKYGEGTSTIPYRSFLVTVASIAGKSIAFVVQHVAPNDSKSTEEVQDLNFKAFRKPQMEQIAAWIKAKKEVYDGIIIMGDWNMTLNQIWSRFKYQDSGTKYRAFNWGNDTSTDANDVYPSTHEYWPGLKKFPYENHNLGMSAAFGKKSHNGFTNSYVAVPQKGSNGKKTTTITKDYEPDVTLIDNILAWGCVTISDVKYKYTDIDTCDHPVIGCTITVGGSSSGGSSSGGTSGGTDSGSGGSTSGGSSSSGTTTTGDVTYTYAQLDAAGKIVKNKSVSPQSGEESSISTVDATAMIDVSGYSKIKLNYKRALYGAYYNSDGSVNSNYTSTLYVSGQTAIKQDIYLSIPNGIKYARLNISHDAISDWQMTLVE